jgi:5-methylcytosine-specific restriction enzyme A
VTEDLYFDEVPLVGPLAVGAVYRRAQLHSRFGGSRFSGIVPSKIEPVVLLFHTMEPAQQFYRDGFDADGVYWYSGEGSVGDMSWTASNRAIRDHEKMGFDLLFFERVQRKDGLWRFAQIFSYFTHKDEKRVDKAGKHRSAIVFGLLPFTMTSQIRLKEDLASDLTRLRAAAMNAFTSKGDGVRAAVRNVYLRNEAVRAYALRRASGVCEACGLPAPFTNETGVPFLEVHHIDRLADNGPDRIDRVAAVCPNCHRRCHYAIDRNEYNSILREKIARIEQIDVK